jgi:ribonuclease III
MDNKFKSDPYNNINKLITSDEVLNILNKLNIQDYKIKDLSLFQKAFVHSSYCEMKDYEEYIKPEDCLSLLKDSYETLEFLGDSFLGCIVSNYLYSRYVNEHLKDEGFLTKLKIRLVCGEQLAYLSKCLNFQEYIIISKHIEDNCNGRENEHILEDVFEAFIGALYRDSKDYNLIVRFIITIIQNFIDISDLIQTDNNYKDKILRYLQKNFSSQPKYETNKREGLNDFISTLILPSDNIIIEGFGKTKKKAEQDVSKNALIHYRVISE